MKQTPKNRHITSIIFLLAMICIGAMTGVPHKAYASRVIPLSQRLNTLVCTFDTVQAGPSSNQQFSPNCGTLIKPPKNSVGGGSGGGLFQGPAGDLILQTVYLNDYDNLLNQKGFTIIAHDGDIFSFRFPTNGLLGPVHTIRVVYIGDGTATFILDSGKQVIMLHEGERFLFTFDENGATASVKGLAENIGGNYAMFHLQFALGYYGLVDTHQTNSLLTAAIVLVPGVAIFSVHLYHRRRLPALRGSWKPHYHPEDYL